MTMHEGFEQIPIDFAMERVIIGCLRQMRDRIDEDVIRFRWRMTEGSPLKERVLVLLCSNGPEYHAIMLALREAGYDA